MADNDLTIDTLLVSIRRQIEELNENIKTLNRAGVKVGVKVVQREKLTQIGFILELMPKEN